MLQTSPLLYAALGAIIALLMALVALQRRALPAPVRATKPEALDTVAAWPPEGARVLTVTERHAYELLRRAMPGNIVLAQVPLSRFVHVPTQHAYSDWLQRAGQLSADLLLCDNGSRVLLVVDIRSTSETERSRRRHERLARVLRAAGIHVLTWNEGKLPGVVEARRLVAEALRPEAAAGFVSVSGHMPLIPVAEIQEMLAEGDALDHSMEPVPSGFYDDLEPARHSTRH